VPHLPHTVFSSTKNHHPIGGAESFGGHFRVIRKVPRTWGTEYRGQKSKVGTITVYVVYREKKEKRKGKKRGDQIDLKLRVLSMSIGAESKSGDDNSICIQRKKIKNKRKKKRGPN
jgi:hypothetical protein